MSNIIEDTNLGNKQVFAENFNYYLEKSGKKKIDIARDLGISQCTISDWVKCRTYPRMDKIESLAKIFGCEMSELVEKHTLDNVYYLGKVARDVTSELMKSQENLTAFLSFTKLSPQNQTIVRLMIDSLAKGEK
jgi:transcriptional regulator with XRE-family HTH domain